MATVSPLVSFPVATQESVAGPSQRTPVLAKRARVEPPGKTPEITNKESCGKNSKDKVWGGASGKEPAAAAAAAVGCSLSYPDSDVGNPLPAFTPRREPGFHLGIQNLRNTLASPLDFFQLYFMPVLVDEIVQHMNAYAYIEVAKENSNKRWNTECDESWRDTTPDEILKLLGLLIYFGFVGVKGRANLVYVNFYSFLLF